MKRLLIFISFIIFFVNTYAENSKDSSDCTDKGYPLNKVIKVEKTIQKALKANDKALFAEQFNYPFAVNLPHGRHIIFSKQELIGNLPLIYSRSDMGAIIAEKNLIPFCRYDGAAIFGGMWLSTDKDKNLKVFVINANQTTKLNPDTPYGTPIMPISDLNLLKTFANMYKSSNDSIKIQDYKLLQVESKWNDDYRPNLTGNSGLSGTQSRFLLYYLDINNDKEPEWVLVNPMGGSMGTSGIEAVYKSRGKTLEIVNFDNIITSNFNLGDMSRWYLFINDPLFTIYKGKIVFSFYNSRPAQVCSYLWQNNKVMLVHGDQNYCIH